jgi:hypothetical protein
MSEDTHTQERWLIAGVAVLAILLILVVIGLIRSIPGRGGDRGKDPRIGHRSPATELAYCRPQDTRLCIISFDQVEEGDMLVHFQLPAVIYPQFTLIINRFGVASKYECQRTKGILINVTCAGASQVPGEILQFKVFSKMEGTLIAEGNFAIIGIAISTPEGNPTPTETAIETPTESPTETPVNLTPIPTQALPTELVPTQELPTLPVPPTSYP